MARCLQEDTLHVFAVALLNLMFRDDLHDVFHNKYNFISIVCSLVMYAIIYKATILQEFFIVI